YARESFPEGRPLLAAVLDLTRRIHQDFRFDKKATEVATPVQTFFEKRRGVCQDFAHLQIGCMRSLGLPARYVSGYLRTMPPPGRPRLVGADASHAWCSAWCPGAGWGDFDPTNNCVPSDGHITVAWGRGYRGAGATARLPGRLLHSRGFLPASFEKALSTHSEGSSFTARRMRSCHQSEICSRSLRS